MLYMGVIKEFARLIKSDLYILPSSIHELILLPFDDTKDKEALKRMVMEINGTQVAADEVLSDNVYIYSLKTDAIML